MSAIFAIPKPEDAHCTDVISLYLSSAPVNICTDIAILVLPMPVLRTLTLPRKQKIILYVTFGFFLFATIIDIVRIAFLQQASVTRLSEIQANSGKESAASTDSMDFAFYASFTYMMSAVEVCVGINCACVPALKPLASRFFPWLLRDEGEMTPHLSSAGTGDDTSPPWKQPSAALSGSNSSNSNSNSNDDDHMTFQDFLTTPDMAEIPRMARTDTVMTNTSVYSPTARSFSRTFFDFVNLGESRTLMFLSNKESIRPFLAVSLLFFLWGFAYGLLNTLNNQFQVVAHMSVNQGVALHSAYFVGYVIGPLTIGRLVLIHWGFKHSFIVGLSIYGVGCLVFWPSAVLTSFPAFFISNLIVGIGLSILELSANPFIILCGPSQFGEARLNLAQAIQACGTVVSPLLAKKVLFVNNILNAPSLVRCQWTYLALALFCFALAFVYYLVKLPEASDLELEALAQNTFSPSADDSVPSLKELRSTRTTWTTLGLATAAMFFYVGAQECVSTDRSNYFVEAKATANTINLGAISTTSFAGSRFLAALLGLLAPTIFQPRHIILFLTIAAVVFSVLAMKSYPGATGIAMVVTIYATEGPLFGLIFAQGMRGLGKHTKNASAILTAAIGGGAVFPPIMSAVARGHIGHNASYAYAFCVPIALFATMLIFPLYLELFPLARKQTDPLTGIPSDATKRLAWSALGLRRRGTVTSAATESTTGHEPQSQPGYPSPIHTRTNSHNRRSSLFSSPPSPRTVVAPPQFILDSLTLATYDNEGFTAHDFAFNNAQNDTNNKERIASTSSAGAASDTPLLRVFRRLSSVFSANAFRRQSRADSATGSPVEPKAETDV